MLAGCATQTGPRAGLDAADLKVASIELSTGSPQAALEVLQQHLAGNPRDAAALVMAGDAQSALGEADVAGASYRQALAISPGLLNASLGIAKLKLAREPAAATLEFAALAARYPHDARIWTDLGVSYDLQSQSDEAQRCYRRAMSEDASLISAQVDLGLSLALSGRSAEGVPLLRAIAARPQSSPRMRQDLAAAETIAGNSEAARAVLQQDLPPLQVASAMSGYAALRELAP